MVDTKRLIKALRLSRLSCGIKKPCSDCELMEDCLYYQQNGAKEAADTIEHLETENAALREQIKDTFQVHLIEEIKRLEQKNTALYLQLDKVKKQAELWKKRFKLEERSNEISAEEPLNVTAERDAALNDLRGKCSVCVHYTSNHREGVCAHCCREYMSDVIACSDLWQ